MMPYEFCAIDKDGFKDFIKNNIESKSYQFALIALLDSVPDIIVRHSTHGEWVRNGSYYSCSCCKYNVSIDDKDFCPGCGARMDKED